MAPPDTAGELARRAAAQVLLLETPVHTDDSDVLFLLVILKTLRLAGARSLHSNRMELNIFDVINSIRSVRMNATQLYAFLGPRVSRHKLTLKPPTVAPLGRSLLRAFGDDEDEEENPDQALRPSCLLDIYPPFPRPYTFRRTETRGIREADKVLIAKAKAEQQRQVESNLYRLLSKTNSLREVVNFDEDS